MSSNIVAALIVAGAILILSAVLYLNYRQRQRVRAQVEKERREREENERRRKLQAKQRQAGHLLFAELSQAAAQNKVSNAMRDGTFARNAGAIEVERLEQNGGLGYSIIVSMPDPTCMTMGGLRKPGYPLCQVNINLEKEGKEIHVFRGPYGPERDYSADEFNDLRSNLYEWVQTYRMFTDPRPSDILFKV